MKLLCGIIIYQLFIYFSFSRAEKEADLLELAPEGNQVDLSAKWMMNKILQLYHPQKARKKKMMMKAVMEEKRREEGSRKRRKVKRLKAHRLPKPEV